MKDWNYAKNDIYKTASYILEEGPWYSFLLEWLIQSLCDNISSIPIPFGSKLKIHSDFFNETFTLKEYYGDCQGVFHCLICDPVTRWCDKKRKTIVIDAKYKEGEN